MKTNFFLLMFLIQFSIPAFSQQMRKLKGDSVIMHSGADGAEFIITNASKDTTGFLFNKSKGRTEFRRNFIKLNDSGHYLVGIDTLKIPNNDRWKSTPSDINGSVQYTKNGNFSGDGFSFFWDTLYHRLNIGDSISQSHVNIVTDDLKNSVDETDGIALINTVPATASTIQRSPVIRMSAQGWKSSATAQARPMQVSTNLTPVAGNNTTAFGLEWAQKKAGSTLWFRIMALSNLGLNVWGTSSAQGFGGLSFSDLYTSAAAEILGTESLGFITTISTNTTGFTFTASHNTGIVSGATKSMRLKHAQYGFYPGSGNATYTLLSLESKINQTGSANGISRGLRIAPIITAAVDFRAIEIEQGAFLLRSIHLSGAGDKINIATGVNAIVGTATLSSGTVTVNSSSVTAASLIFVNYITPSGTSGQLSSPSGSIVAGTSFVINSSSVGDNSVVSYWILN